VNFPDNICGQKQGVEEEFEDSLMGKTPLWAAVDAYNVNIVKYLILEAGASVNQPTTGDHLKGVTPLCRAVFNDDGPIVEFLVEEGQADVNLGPTKVTPLKIAQQRGLGEMVKYLKKHGADDDSRH